MIRLPARPHVVPDFRCDPGSVKGCGDDLLAASAQVDDAGSYAAGDARAGDWTGRAATAYRGDAGRIGERADAMSLALRGVARRVQDHAEELTTLETDHGDLEQRRSTLQQRRSGLRAEASRPMTPAEERELQAECDRVQTQVQDYEHDLSSWKRALQTEEQEMVQAFSRVMALDAVERHYGGAADPADDALARKPPPGSTPEQNRDWWSSLTQTERDAIMAASPGSVGNLDGIPARDRHEANIVSLTRDLADWEHTDRQGVLTDDEQKWLDNARAARDALEDGEQRYDPVTGEKIPLQVWMYDPQAFDGDGRIGIAAGDLDTADNVSLITPGFGTDATSIGGQLDKATNIYEAARHGDPNASHATMAWIGYDAPDNFPVKDGWGADGAGVTREDMAAAGGERLSDSIDGLRASREDDPSHMTAIGHSYGSATLGRGAEGPGLDVDDIVVTGSPGLGGDTHHASDLGIDQEHVWVGRNSQDFVAGLADNGWVNNGTLGGAGLGDDPASDDFDANRFQAESVTRDPDNAIDNHNNYYEHGTESLDNIAHVVNGQYDQVQGAGQTTDPWWRTADDPEKDRDPRWVDTGGS